MFRRCGTLLVVALAGIFTSCQKAEQYPSLDKKAAAPKESRTSSDDKNLHLLSWLETAEPRGIPLVFVADTHGDWEALPADWTHFPGVATVFGVPLSPVEAAATVAFAEGQRVVRVKVPRGLPDPTPNIPATNLPNLGKWKLGKDLFHIPFLKVGKKSYSCNTCHDARHAFAANPSDSPGAKFETLSLINVAYQRDYFWDGRVRTLEETLFRSADDERSMEPEKRLEQGLSAHVWGGFVQVLDGEKRIQEGFEAVFGIDHPTQDAAARALATYLRTLLVGDSVYDRAEAVRRERKAPALTALHFAEVVKDETTAGPLRETVGSDKPRRSEIPDLLAKGHELFHGKGRCAQCHRGPLFSDHDFHNIACDPKLNWPGPGKETGRALQVPIGLKEARFIGAFRTPSLRNLAQRTAFFHDGSRHSLRDVVDFYDAFIPAAPRLAETLKERGNPQRLEMTPQDVDALVIFLRALQGRGLGAPVTNP